MNLEQNHKHFREEQQRLESWAEAQVAGAEEELTILKRKIADVRRRTRQAVTMQDQHELQAEMTRLEATQRQMRKNIFKVEDEIAEKRDQLVDALEKRMRQKTTVTPLFTIRWRVI